MAHLQPGIRCPGLLQGSSDPEKVFDRTANLENTQIINYRVDPQEKWCVLVGIAPGAPERYAPPTCTLHYTALCRQTLIAELCLQTCFGQGLHAIVLS